MTSIQSPNTSLAMFQAMQAANAQSAKSAEKDVKDAKELARVEEAAKQFESVFVAEMLKPMFEGTTPGDPFNGGKGEEVFHGMMIQEYGKIIADNGGIGLSSQIREQMIKMQEQANNAQ